MNNFPGQQRPDQGPTNPGPNQGPTNPGPEPSDGLEEGRQPTGGRNELQQQRHEEYQDANEEEEPPVWITVSQNEINRAKFLENFMTLELEGYTMLDVMKLAENEFKIYQAKKISFDSYMLQIDGS
jgi:hypothetical protein